MENTKYEIMYIIRLNTDEEAKAALIERFDVILKDSGAEATGLKDWEERRSAYEMNGYREGVYHIVKVSFPPSVNAVNELNCLAKVNDDIIRHMIVEEEAQPLFHVKQ